MANRRFDLDLLTPWQARWHRLAERFLRCFKLYRHLDERLTALQAERAFGSRYSSGTIDRIEQEILHKLYLVVPCAVHVDVLPTVESDDVGPGELRVRLFVGRRHG
jgi:hypothetical protein